MSLIPDSTILIVPVVIFTRATLYAVESVALLVARRTNNQKVVSSSSRPTKVVCITVLTGNRLG